MVSLTVLPNPRRNQIVTSHLEGVFVCSALSGEVDLSLLYQPDREVVTAENFNKWVGKQAEKDWTCPEDFAGALLENFYDTLLPKQVTLTLTLTSQQGADTIAQKIQVEAAQPKPKARR